MWHYLVTSQLGLFGSNAASESNQNQKDNATEIYYFFTNRGWTLNAIAGMLGNIQVESMINPAQGEYLGSGGYGLVQWTPASNYTNWAEQHGYAITDGNYQCVWIEDETVRTGQWIPTSAYSLSFSQYKSSTQTADYLARAWSANFERPREFNVLKATNATWWYNYFSSPPPPPTTFRKKMPIYFYLRRY